MKQRGFTVIELFMVIVILIVGSWLFFSERAAVNAAQRDATRKTAINAMYYNLEEVYYPKYGYYPSTISDKNLRAMDPALFTDPEGNQIGTAGSDYHYTGTNCTTDGHCKSYRLDSTMEREADYVKTSRNS